MINKILDNPFVQYSLMLFLILGALSVIFPPDFLMIKWGANYAIQILFIYFFTGLLFFVLNKTRLMFVALIGAASISLFLKYSSNSEIASLPPSINLPVIKISHINLDNVIDTGDELFEIINKIDADITSFQEVTPFWDSILMKNLAKKYPYSFSNIDIGIFGMAVFSKLPFTEIDTMLFNEIPNIVGKIQLDTFGNKFHFISSHTYPALNYFLLDMQKNHFDWIAKLCDSLKTPIITIGDYNSVPWSAEIKRFRRQTRLLDSRMGLNPSYDGKFPVLEVPIDHIFYSHEFRCLDFDNIGNSNSTHLGIMASFQLTNKAK